MQKVAAYLLERRENMDWPEARNSEARALREEVSLWLKSKGATLDGPTGTYASEDGSRATYRLEEAADGNRSWSMAYLDETASDGRRFVATVSVTATDATVAVYATLEAGSATSRIGPIDFDPRCPRLIKTFLTMPGDWYHGDTRLRGLQEVVGFDQGEGLAAFIADPTRVIPAVVVTLSGGNPALPRLHARLADDLAGIANVFAADIDACWALTDGLGKPMSVYDGAVRLYWPRWQRQDDPFRHPLWTAARLNPPGVDPFAVRERFRKQLRTTLMRASALSVVRPREIDDIRSAAAMSAFRAMKARATSLADFRDIAESYAVDNDKLRKELAAIQDQLDESEVQVAELEQKLKYAEYRLQQVDEPDEDLAPDTAPADPGDAPPASGDVRFYKKQYSHRKHDVMVSVQDCGCNNWESANSADKAKKGIAKLEGGRRDWSLIQHCASCTGGGMWRVRW